MQTKRQTPITTIWPEFNLFFNKFELVESRNGKKFKQTEVTLEIRTYLNLA